MSLNYHLAMLHFWKAKKGKTMHVMSCCLKQEAFCLLFFPLHASGMLYMYIIPCLQFPVLILSNVCFTHWCFASAVKPQPKQTVFLCSSDLTAELHNKTRSVNSLMCSSFLYFFLRERKPAEMIWILISAFLWTVNCCHLKRSLSAVI